jgi:lipoprotein NlpD
MSRRVWPALIALALGSVPQAAWPAPVPIIAWTYTVQPGDTLATIAARMGVSPGDLARTNGIGLETPLAAGTVIKRPDPNGMPSERRPPRRPPAPPRAAPMPRPAPAPRPLPEPVPTHRAVAEAPHRPQPGAPHLIWPTSGAVVARFAEPIHGQTDNGIDLTAFAGMPVRAAAAGRVIFAGTEPERFGQLIVIDHGGGWATAYAYLGKVVVADGAVVRAGSVIARIGASGEARKPTLHFELRHDNVPQDPIPVLPIRL